MTPNDKSVAYVVHPAKNVRYMPLIPEKAVSCFVDTGESGRLCRAYWRKGSAMLLTLANMVGYAVDTREKE
jgi:hypothetical protein